MVALVAFRPLLSFRKCRFAIPLFTRLAPAWRFLSLRSPSLSKNTMLHRAIAEMLHLLTFFIASAAKSPPATFVSARPRSRRLRCDFCCTSPLVFACRRKIYTVRPVHSVFQAAPGGGTRSESLILRLFALGRACHCARNELLQSQAYATAEGSFTCRFVTDGKSLYSLRLLKWSIIAVI
jgi:hypothetical protein